MNEKIEKEKKNQEQIVRGIDISSRRLDDLEKEFMKFIISGNNRDVVLDLGSGEGNVGISAGFLNKDVYLYDIYDFKDRVEILKKNFAISKISFTKIDLSKVNYKTFPKNISAIYGGRFLHYLQYENAENLLKILFKNLKTGGKVFFSVTGVETEIANGYDKNIKIEKRFFKIKDHLQERFLIKEKVTLYKKEEFEKLFENAGFKKEKV
jgi:SAM-dependent methyltransferase